MKSIRILTILITSLLIYNAESVFCQDYLDIVKTYGNNYFELKRNLEDYFNQYDSLKVIKGSGYKEFVRWDLFWQDRIDSSGDFSLTDISLTNHLLELINNPEIYKGSSEYLYTWNCIGPDSNDRPNAFSSQGLISSIWVDTSNFMTVLAGSNSGGLFVTDDNGDHWMALNDHIPTLGAESIAVNHLNKDVIYVGTGAQNNVLGIYNGYSYGVLLSNDRGISWDTTGMNKFTFHYQTPSGLKYESYTCGDIIMNPSDTSCLYLLVNRKGNYTNLMKSNDRASTWDSIYAEQNVLFNDIEFKPNDPTVIYLAGEKLIKLSGNPIQGTDLTSLLQLEQGYSINRLEAAVTKDDPQILYVLCYSTHSDDYLLQLFRSFNGGESFSKVDFSDYDRNMGNPSMMELKISNQSHDIFYTAGLYMFKFTIDNNIANNDSISTDYHVDVRDLVLYEGSSNQDIIYFGNDGGVTMTENGGNTFTDISKKGLVNTQFYGFGITDGSDFIMGGTQDGNKSIYRKVSDKWGIHMADAYGGVISPLKPEVVYSRGYYYQGLNTIPIIKSIDKAIHFDDLPSYPDDTIYRYDVPLCIHPDSADVLYVGYHDVFKSADGGTTWTKITNFTSDFEVPGTHKLRIIAISHSDPQIIYAGFEDPVWGFSHTERKKLFKSTDRGATWHYIDNNKIAGLEWAGITDLKVNAENEDDVWISLSVGTFDGTWNHKVYRTTDGGSTFMNISDSLPDVPVNTIEIDRLSEVNDVYIGTDLGVFRTNDTLLNQSKQYWVPYNKGLPYTIVTDLQIDYFTGKLLASTFGRGFWENNLPSSDPCAEELLQPLHISEDTTWQGYLRMMRDVIVDSGTHLVIKGKVFFHPKAYLKITNGASVELDGGILTNACEELPWQGIQIWGDENHSQMESSYFGRLDMMNNARIENAETAVSTTRLDEYGFPVDGYNGGIVKCINSTFLNNTKSVEFFPFTNYHPIDQKEIRYFASFFDCSFELNNDAFGWSKTAEKESMIRMPQVNGVDFLGCDFTCVLNDSIPLDSRPYGILSLGSQFYIDEYCMDPSISPCQEFKPSSFYGLDYGIKALGMESIRTISVKNSDFIDNLTGIYLGGINNATITNNNFEIAEADTSIYTIFGGLYLDYCSGYTVEENFFTKGNMPENDKTFLFGMVVKDSGDDPNEIYNNIFTNVDVGIEALNHNRGEGNREGLVIKCNDFNTSTRYNIVVTRENDTIEPAGVAYYQGSNDDVTAPAGNLFWINQWVYVHHYINELDRYPIIYTMHDPSSNIRVKPINYTESTITLDSTTYIFSKELACPSHLSDTSTNPDALKSEMYVIEASIDSAQTVLSIWIDGGETEVTINDIEQSTPPEAYDVYSDLMLKSPYLSDTVMLESIEKENVINNSMIEDILVANPQAAKSYKIAEALDGKSYPLGLEQRENINQGKFSTSNKEKLEAKLSTRIHSKTMIQDDLITIYLNDTVNGWAIDSLEVFLSEINTLRSNYQLSSMKMIQGDSLSVVAILDDIENSFEMNSRKLSAHQKYISYSILFMNKLFIDVWSNNLDSLTRVDLLALSSHRSLPGQYALNILQFYDTLQYFEPYIIPQDLMKSLAIGKKPTSNDSQSEDVFKIYPNPAISYFVLEFNQDLVSQDEASFIICDELGRTIQEYLIDSESDHKVIRTSSLGKGIFLCKFVRGNKIVQTEKLIVL